MSSVSTSKLYGSSKSEFKYRDSSDEDVVGYMKEWRCATKPSNSFLWYAKESAMWTLSSRYTIVIAAVFYTTFQTMKGKKAIL